MKRIARLLLAAAAVIVVLIGVGITATIGWRPFIGPKARPLTDRKYEPTPERLARGKYLTENVLSCFDCHSEREWEKPGAPVLASAVGAGRVWTAEGMPWLAAPNITPDKETGIGSLSDDAIARAVREGIGHDGRALFPIMPYTAYRHLSDEDLASVVAYVKSLQPIRKVQPASAVPFPVKHLIKSVPQPIETSVPEPADDPVSRGNYLVTVAGCSHCHTPQKQGKEIESLALAGGFVLEAHGKKVASSNITQHASGISYYDEKRFIEVMRTGHVGSRPLSAIMPWTIYKGMTDEDLRAMFAYLKTVKPVKHTVDNSEPPTLCKLDGLMHGGGASN